MPSNVLPLFNIIKHKFMCVQLLIIGIKVEWMFLAALAVLFKISISVIDILDFKAIFIFQPSRNIVVVKYFHELF